MMNLSEKEGIEGKTFVVTGGEGFVGSALCHELLRRGARQVRSLDLKSNNNNHHDNNNHDNNNHILFFQGDIVKKQDVHKAVRGADCVFHLASFGMSGKEMLQMARVDHVNITGTCNLIDACLHFGVPRLVYVSTYNVVFGSLPILNGNESLPYLPIDDHADPYGRAKSIAEQLVLNHNARPFPNMEHSGKRLYTCAIRPAAIYGPREERHLPRLLFMAKLGLTPFRIGDSDVKSDWLYIDNLVLALLLASMGLLDDIPGRERPVAAGQAYFISDGSPVNSFDFVQPLLKSLGYNFPKRSLSVPQALVLGRICSVVYSILYPWLNQWWLPQPFILPAEVFKVGVTHYFSFLKAKQELGYVPIVSPREGMEATISYWKEKKRKSLDGPTIWAWLFVLIGMPALFAAAYLPGVGPVPMLRAISLFILRSMWMVRLVFLLAAALHIGEAAYAWNLAKRVDPANARGWLWQTFLLGIFSLRFLLKRAKQVDS